MKKWIILIALLSLLLSASKAEAVISVTRTAPPDAPANVVAAADNGWQKVYSEEAGTLVDRTTEFSDAASDVQFMAADDDYVYFAVEATLYSGSTYYGRFCDIHVDLATPASVDLGLTFEYNTGNNSWATLTVVDGTAGMTQSGTITFTRASFPTTGQWKKGSQDGSGNEIGDGTDRWYVRLKRTTDTVVTPPTENEMGTGLLTANTTYYYRASSFVTDSTVYHSDRRSVACAEVNATTTTIKRSIKISWDNNAANTYYGVWRTPISGDYKYCSQYPERLSWLDTYGCQVKGRYFHEQSGNTTTQDYVVDDAFMTTFTYYAPYIFYSYYLSNSFRNYARGTILVEGGTAGAGVADFDDIYDADQTNGWNTFTKNSNPYSYKSKGWRDFTCHDNLRIIDYFADNAFTVSIDSAFETNESTSVIFGVTGTGDKWQRGGNIIMSGCVTNNYYWYFANTTCYRVRFADDCWDLGTRLYCRMSLGNSCELYGTNFEAYQMWENTSFDGTNIIAEDVLVSNCRYGFTIGAGAMATISATGLTIQGGTGLYSYYWPDPTTATFSGFTFRGVGRFITDYSSTNKTRNLHMVNMTLINTTVQSGFMTLNSLIYEDYDIALTVVDEDGVAIGTADVSVTNNVGTAVSGQTDGDGEWSDVVCGKLYSPGTSYGAYSQYYMDVVTDYNPFTITVSKSGYETYTGVVTIDKKTDWDIVLDKGDTVLTDVTLYDATIY